MILQVTAAISIKPRVSMFYMKKWYNVGGCDGIERQYE